MIFGRNLNLGIVDVSRQRRQIQILQKECMLDEGV